MRSFSIYRLTIPAVLSAFFLFACETDNRGSANGNTANDDSTAANSDSIKFEGDEYCSDVYAEVLEKYKQDYRY